MEALNSVSLHVGCASRNDSADLFVVWVALFLISAMLLLRTWKKNCVALVRGILPVHDLGWRKGKEYLPGPRLFTALWIDLVRLLFQARFS